MAVVVGISFQNLIPPFVRNRETESDSGRRPLQMLAGSLVLPAILLALGTGAAFIHNISGDQLRELNREYMMISDRASLAANGIKVASKEVATQQNLLTKQINREVSRHSATGIIVGASYSGGGLALIPWMWRYRARSRPSATKNVSR